MSRDAPQARPGAGARAEVGEDAGADAGAHAADDDRRRIQRPLDRADHRAGLRQLTGRELVAGRVAVDARTPSDPYVDVLPDGRVEVHGTGPIYLAYPTLDDLLRGGPYERRTLASVDDLAEEVSWDHLIRRWPGGPEVLYAGVMRPTSGRARPAWPDDNWTRRIYPFSRDAAGRWRRHDRPLFGALAADSAPRMVGHAYGHHFLDVVDPADGATTTWLFHDEVVAEGPMRTEIFARRMIDPFTAADDRIRVVGVDPVGRSAFGRRASGEYLVEGPRPFVVVLDGDPISLVAFSAGDFNADGYDVHLAWRRGAGPGEHALLLDRATSPPCPLGLGAALRRRHGLSWLGRAHVLADGRGDWWAVFHAIDARLRPDEDHRRPGPLATAFRDHHRNLYAVPLRFTLDADGAPRVEVLDRPTGAPASAPAAAGEAARVAAGEPGR